MKEVIAVLDHYPLDFRAASIEPLGSAGGMSGAQFWRIHAPAGPLCLRRWPKEHPPADRLRFIHSVLRHAETGGIEFLPLPMCTKDGASFVHYNGYLWELSPWLPGEADFERSPSDAKLCAAMTALARFHIATAGFECNEAISSNDRHLSEPPFPPSNAIRSRLKRLHELMPGRAKEFSQAIESAVWPELAPLARQFLSNLPSALPHVAAMLQPLEDTKLRFQPCIRDIWHDHVLFTGDRVTGVIDFGALDIDTPVCDIARLLGSLVGDDSSGWQKGLAAYSALRPLSVQETDAVRALDGSGTLLAGCNWIRWIYIEGREFENRQQVLERFRKILSRTRKTILT